MIKILWADDEIDLLKSHIIYLEAKGYSLTPAKSGNEALDILESNKFNLIFLDENMPGLTGLETLTIIKEKYPNTCLLYTSPSPRDATLSRMPSSA